MECCNIQTSLIPFAKNQVSKDEEDIINKHLENCFECRENLKQIRMVTNFMRNAAIEPSLGFYERLAAKLDREDFVEPYYPSWRLWVEYLKYRMQNAPLRVAMFAFSCFLVATLPFVHLKFSDMEKQQIRDNLPIWQMPDKENL